MNSKMHEEEYLEQIWYLQESNNATLDELKKVFLNRFDEHVIKNLVKQGKITIDPTTSSFSFTHAGYSISAQLIRAHRIAERLLHDILGIESLQAACEFEHMKYQGVVNGICTLLGHPKQTPSGKAIPAGECCIHAEQSIKTSVIPLTAMECGQRLPIAYINYTNDQLLRQFNGMQLRPGIMISLHQKKPSIVIECEGALIALDQTISESIRVWLIDPKSTPVQPLPLSSKKRFSFSLDLKKKRAHSQKKTRK